MHIDSDLISHMAFNRIIENNFEIFNLCFMHMLGNLICLVAHLVN